MAYTSIYKGVIFVEGFEPLAKILTKVEYKKSHTYNAQIQSLDCVKDQLAEKTVAVGGNAVINFQYGQKSSSWFQSWLLAFDDNIKWYGSGMAAIIPEDVKMRILEKLNQV